VGKRGRQVGNLKPNWQPVRLELGSMNPQLSLEALATAKSDYINHQSIIKAIITFDFCNTMVPLALPPQETKVFIVNASEVQDRTCK